MPEQEKTPAELYRVALNVYGEIVVISRVGADRGQVLLLAKSKQELLDQLSRTNPFSKEARAYFVEQALRLPKPKDRRDLQEDMFQQLADRPTLP